jgi:hypothetical protein
LQFASQVIPRVNLQAQNALAKCASARVIWTAPALLAPPVIMAGVDATGLLPVRSRTPPAQPWHSVSLWRPNVRTGCQSLSG